MEKQPLDWPWYLIYDWATKLASIETNKLKKSVQRIEWANMITLWIRERGKKVQDRRKDKHIDTFKLFFHREISNVHNFFV